MSDLAINVLEEIDRKREALKTELASLDKFYEFVSGYVGKELKDAEEGPNRQEFCVAFGPFKIKRDHYPSIQFKGEDGSDISLEMVPTPSIDRGRVRDKYKKRAMRSFKQNIRGIMEELPQKKRIRKLEKKFEEDFEEVLRQYSNYCAKENIRNEAWVKPKFVNRYLEEIKEIQEEEPKEKVMEKLSQEKNKEKKIPPKSMRSESVQTKTTYGMSSPERCVNMIGFLDAYRNGYL